MILCGTNDVDVQTLVALGNELLGAYEKILDLAAPSRQRAGDDAAFATLVEEIEAGRVGALVVAGSDPFVEAPGGRRLAAALQKVALRVGLAEREDATTAGLEVVLPLPHALEAWDDAEPVEGVVSLTQPAIGPFGEPRSLRACLAAWSGRPAGEQELLRDAWARLHHPRQSALATPEASWRRALSTGFLAVGAGTTSARPFAASAVPAAAPRGFVPPKGRFGLALHATVGMLGGRHAHNPWLHELPDPVTKQVWGNAAALSPAAARALDVVDGDRVRVAAEDGAAVVLPVLVQPGLSDRTVAIALGYGRRGTDRFAGVGPAWIEAVPTVRAGEAVGADASPLLGFARGATSYDGRAVTVERAGGRDVVARSQEWHSLDLPKETAPHGAERRDMVRETTPAALARGEALENEAHEGKRLWGDVPKTEGVRWAMAVDLSACTGCSACVVACQAENNIPVVGRDEVRRRRDMHWMRIDRYFGDVAGAEGEVETVHQPMLCQHCANAPCETVCPVLATVHSADGLNAQVYNRCVGTRYCANNCPYKVRRFNWFEYDRARPLGRPRAQPRRHGAVARGDGEVLVLRAAHPRGAGRGGARGAAARRRRRAHRVPAVVPGRARSRSATRTTRRARSRGSRRTRGGTACSRSSASSPRSRTSRRCASGPRRRGRLAMADDSHRAHERPWILGGKTLARRDRRRLASARAPPLGGCGRRASRVSPALPRRRARQHRLPLR